jgi:16S rRNA (uracil1498-N3)-methyltransferase
MHWESFYVRSEHIRGSQLRLVDEEVHHLTRVMRKQKGDLIWAVDGLGTAYQVCIDSVSRNEILGHIVKTRRRIREPIAELTLAQGILKGDRFDFLVEKVTEIGVRRIIPVTSARSDVVAGPQKITRWKRVAMAAMKQSGRCLLPEISEAVSLDRVLTMGSNYHKRIIAHPGKGSHSVSLTPKSKGSLATQKILMVVGPAGGFSDEEIGMANENGFHSVSLGPRRLRSETSGIVLCTIVLSQLGELE